jgi:polyisoprenoid-binding protein YceI
MSRVLPLLLIASSLPQAAFAAPDHYQIDPVHTRVEFAVSHAGFSQSLGTVSGSTGSVEFDPGDWSSAKLSVSVPVSHLDMGDSGWNRAVGGHGLLDVAQYPVATFVSSRVTAKDPQHASVCGTLTLHGVARDTCLDVTFNQLKRLSLPPFHRIAGFSATTNISRKAFGIDAWPDMVGDAVQLRIEAEATRSNGATDQAPTAPPDAASVPSQPVTHP